RTMRRLRSAPRREIPPNRRRSRRSTRVKLRSRTGSRLMAAAAATAFSLSYNLAMPDTAPRPPDQDPLSPGSASFGPRKEDERSMPWIPMAVGAALLAVVVLALIFFSRSSEPGANGQAHPYSANLKFTDLKLSASENFVGG